MNKKDNTVNIGDAMKDIPVWMDFTCMICDPSTDDQFVCQEHEVQYKADQEKRFRENQDAKRQHAIQQKISANFPSEFQNVQMCRIDKRYSDKIVHWLSDPLNWCLFLQGTVGTGKSYMAYSTVKKWLSDTQEGRFKAFSSMDLVHYMQRDYDGQGSEHYKELQNIDLLLIDDLGTERSTEDSLFQVMRLIYSRHTEMKKTIITTNLSIDDLASKFHPRLTSRIMGGTPIVLKGKDRRLEQ